MRTLNVKRVVLLGVMVGVSLAGMVRRAEAYIDLAPTLTKIVGDSPTIALVEVVSYDRATHQVVLKPLQTFKGTLGTELITHEVAPAGGTAPRQIVQWAVPGSRAVVFASRATSLLCFGTGWYQVRSTGTGPWKQGAERPDLPLAYYGSMNRLTAAVQELVQNKGAVISVVAFGGEGEGASFDLALNRQSLPGVVRLQRIRATMSMPGTVMGASGSATYFIGMGAVDENDVGALLEQLKSSDAMVRAEAVEDLRTLGRKAKSAVPVLTGLLKDPSARVRCAAASAVMKIDPKVGAGAEVLLAGMASKDAGERRYAAAGAGYTEAAGVVFGEKLAGLLKDSDEAVRLTALESVSMLGAAAEKAVPALTEMLDDKDLQIDAADALGRVGPGATGALKKLAELLKSDVPAVRWAAVRGMAQIGGPEAHPAVDFMVKAMNGATEVEGYNMMIYFSLLGPAAADAIPAVQNFRIKNPTLQGTTNWAMTLNRFPWSAGGGGGGRGGPGGGGPGGGGGRGGGPGGLNDLMYVSYVRELGPRLKSLSPILAKGILDNSAGEVPSWGYTILNSSPEVSLGILVPALKSTELPLRERAAVGIGYMGEAGEAAKGEVQAALAKTANEKEKKLLEWTLRKIEGE